MSAPDLPKGCGLVLAIAAVLVMALIVWSGVGFAPDRLPIDPQYPGRPR